MKTMAQMTTAKPMKEVGAIILMIAVVIYFVLPVTALSQSLYSIWVGTRSQTNAPRRALFAPRCRHS